MKSSVIKNYSEERQEIFNKKFGVIFDGEDNTKSVVIENLIDSSPTAKQCAETYQSFLGGAGFEVDLSAVNLSDDPFDHYSPNHLLFDLCEPLSRHKCFFLHVQYNFNYEKVSFTPYPRTLCRLGEKDSNNYSGKIVVSKKGWGKSLKKEEVLVYDVYNPRPEAIQAQVDAAGGWEFYKGQMLYFRLDKKLSYPKSPIETAYQFADTENELGNFYNATTKRGFEDTTYIRHRKFTQESDKRQFLKNVKEVSGMDNASSVLVVEDDWDDERDKTGNFKFDTLPNNVKADKFKHFEESSSNFIRKCWNIPSQLIDYVSGKLGNTSGDDMKMAQAIYNKLIAKDQEKLELQFTELFRNFHKPINPSGSYVIKMYALLDDGTVDYKKT